MIDFTKEKLPPVFWRNNREYYLDPVRQKLIYITPEETVRQQVIAWLLRICKVPHDMIQVEEHLSHYGVNTKRRADIIVDAFSKEDNLIHPLAVVECKAPGVLLGNKTSDQVLDYSEKLGCYYMIMTNGAETICYHYDMASGQYVEIEALPLYHEMLQGEFTYKKPMEIPERLNWKEIMEEGGWREYIGSEFGENTPEPVLKMATNLWECLLYPDHRFPAGDYGLFALKSNLGVRLLEYNVRVVGKECHFTHHGRIAVGKMGSGKVDELRMFVEDRAPELVSGKQFYLGKLTNDVLWNLDDPEVKKLIRNLIFYALIRDEYRVFVKENAACQKAE